MVNLLEKIESLAALQKATVEKVIEKVEAQGTIYGFKIEYIELLNNNRNIEVQVMPNGATKLDRRICVNLRLDNTENETVLGIANELACAIADRAHYLLGGNAETH